MKKLIDLIEIEDNNEKCVVLRVLKDSRLELIKLGCFNGNEELIRLTKGPTQTCTLFYKNHTIAQWQWGYGGTTVVDASTREAGKMIERCIMYDLDILIETSSIHGCLFIQSKGATKGMTQTYKILKRDNDATDMSLYRDGMYVRRITDEYEEDVKEFIYGQFSNIISETEEHGKNTTATIITGIRK